MGSTTNLTKKTVSQTTSKKKTKPTWLVEKIMKEKILLFIHIWMIYHSVITRTQKLPQNPGESSLEVFLPSFE